MEMTFLSQRGDTFYDIWAGMLACFPNWLADVNGRYIHLNMKKKKHLRPRDTLLSFPIQELTGCLLVLLADCVGTNGHPGKCELKIC